MASELLDILGTATVASSCAVLLILLLRKPLRTFFGPSIAYFLWLLVPTSILVPLLPAPSAGLKTVLPVPVPLSMPSLTGHVAMVSTSSGLAWVPWLIFAWAIGALLFGLRLARQQRHFIASLGLPIRDDGGVLHAAFPTGSPVVVGLVRPKIVVPSDFAARYASAEQTLILAHERMHICRGDLITNAMWALARSIFWFNPLVHIAARLSRFDQELACDAAVMRDHPNSRKPYATAMLRAQIADDALPLGCYWPSTHPLKERIMLLKQPPARGLRRMIGRILVASCVCLIGYGTWALEPDVAASGESAGINISDSGVLITSDDAATPGGVAIEQSSAAASLPAPQRAAAPLPPSQISAPAGVALEQSSAPASIPAPQVAAGLRAPLPRGQVWHCVIDGQHVFSDTPCGENASIRRVNDPNVMGAPLAQSYDYGNPYAQPFSAAQTLAPSAADESGYDSESPELLGTPGRPRRPHPHPNGPKS
jgi:beta-lactamase regulating signal transducer with metallopeptidase domain